MVDQRGWKLRVGAVIPSTHTIVQPDFDDLRLDGITNHVARIGIPNIDIKTDDDFDKLVRLSEADLVAAVDRILTADPEILVVGMSSLIVWDGYDASCKRKAMLEQRSKLPVTGGSFAVAEALNKFGAKTIGIISPYMPIANKHISQFFTDIGFEVKNFIGLQCPSPVEISHVTPDQLSEALDQVDETDIDALVQFGTNLHFMEQAALEEEIRKKPVISINSASYWHALRLKNIETRYKNYGRLLAEF